MGGPEVYPETMLLFRLRMLQLNEIDAPVTKTSGELVEEAHREEDED